MSESRDVKGDLKHDGYSQEEKYFYELNRKLIRSIREKFEEPTAPRVENPKTPPPTESEAAYRRPRKDDTLGS
ncbi:MAG: hypothetical protein JST04_01455 [Bdellovibrionales bacterium]|nr:hypothetical protein [Bdellovibrionales bacterium]